jgi:hypothetical protein
MAKQNNPLILIAGVLVALVAVFVFIALRGQQAQHRPQVAGPAERAPDAQLAVRRSTKPSKSDSVAQLQRWLGHARPKFREWAIGELSRRPPSKAVLAALVAALDHRSDEYVRAAAQKRLAALGPKALSVAQAIADCVETKRLCGEWGGLVLGNMGPGALPQLTSLARSTAPAHARRKAAYALSLMRCHGPKVTALLRRLAKDRHVKARTLARAALRDPCTRRPPKR